MLELTTADQLKERETGPRREREREMDLKKGNKKTRKAKETSGELWDSEREMRVPHLPHSQPCLGLKPPVTPHTKQPPHPPHRTSLCVATPFMLSPCEYQNSLLLFNSLGRSGGHSTAHHPATKHTHTLSNVTLCAFLRMHKRKRTAKAGKMATTLKATQTSGVSG